MGLDDVGTGESRAGTGTAREGLVVLVGFVPESVVIHRSRSLRPRAQGRIQRTGDRLRGFHIPGDHPGRIVRSEHRAGRNADVQWLQTTGVQRDVIGDQGAEYVQHIGMSSATKVRNTYSTAALATAAGALKLLANCAEVPAKSIVAVRVAGSGRICTAMTAPLSSS